MSRPCPIWGVIAIALTVCVLAFALLLVSFKADTSPLRTHSLTGAATHVTAPDLLIRYCEALVARADATVSTAQLLLALIAVGGTVVVIRSSVTVRELREEHQAALERVERLRKDAEERLESVLEQGEQRLQHVIEQAETRLRDLAAAKSEFDMLIASAAQPRETQEEDRERSRLLSQVAEMMGERANAARLLEQVADIDRKAGKPDIVVLTRLSGLLDGLGQYDRADQYAKAALAVNGDDVGANFNRSVIQIHMGTKAEDPDEKKAYWTRAVDTFEKLRQLDETSGRKLLNDIDRGKLWLFAGEIAENMATLSEGDAPGKTNWQQHAFVWYREGKIYLQGLALDSLHPGGAAAASWEGNALDRMSKLHRKVPEALVVHALIRSDIARMDNELPFTPVSHEQTWQQDAPA
jgi:tetratricopeptide (TPR) repeat protein